MAQDSDSFSSIVGHLSLDLGIYSSLWRILWLRRDTSAESPVLMPMESSIDLNIYTDDLKVVNQDKVRVDETLKACMISKALVNRLEVPYTAVERKSITDATSTVHSHIGIVELQWHKRTCAKTQVNMFDVIDSPSEWVIMGMNALLEDKNDIKTLGLRKQTEGTTSYELSQHAEFKVAIGS